jgi:FtsP/CotA-like multicopper oxidase with cupredoxin domain
LKQNTRPPARYKHAHPHHWRDATLLDPDDALTTAFMADNTGKWMRRYLMRQHQERGTMTWFEVTTAKRRRDARPIKPRKR